MGRLTPLTDWKDEETVRHITPVKPQCCFDDVLLLYILSEQDGTCLLVIFRGAGRLILLPLTARLVVFPFTVFVLSYANHLLTVVLYSICIKMCLYREEKKRRNRQSTCPKTSNHSFKCYVFEIVTHLFLLFLKVC